MRDCVSADAIAKASASVIDPPFVAAPMAWPLGRIVAVLIVLQVLLICYRVRNSWLFSDDFFGFIVYQEMGFTLKYLFRDVFGQVAPGFRAVHALQYELAGVSFVATQFYIVVLSVLSSYLLVRIAMHFTTSRWSIVALLIVYIFSLQALHMQLWWSSALHTVSCMATMLLAIHAALQGRFLLSAVAYAIGLSFTAKAIFSIIPVAGFYWASVAPLRSRSDIWRAAARFKFHVLALALYVAMVVVVSPGMSAPRGSVAEVALFVWNAFADGAAASSIGLGSQASSAPQPLAAIGAAVLLAVVAIVTIRAQPRNAILWATYLAYVVLGILPVAIQRAGMFGSGSGSSLRYNVETSALLIVVLMIALSSLRPSLLMRMSAIAAGVAIAGVLQWQSTNVSHAWDIAATKKYMQNLQRSLASLPPEAAIVDEETPDFVVPKWLAPYNTTQRISYLLRPDLKRAGRASAMYRVDPSGVAVQLVSERTAPQ